jgi:TM2 domain-containing membrane protein YozV
MVHCRACGKEIHESARVCPQCGAPQATATGGSDKKILPAFLLCCFLGWAGAHRFYVGKIGTGILMLCTAGLFGVLWLIDFIMIIVGAFTDKAGNKITEWV